MTVTAEPRLLQIFCEFGDLKGLNKSSKANLRLCNQQIKAFVDSTVIACKVTSDALDALLCCDWHLEELEIKIESEEETDGDNLEPSPESWNSLLYAIVVKFQLLEKLFINESTNLEALPANIGQLSHLKSLRIVYTDKIIALPLSFGQLTALERLEICMCSGLTIEGLAPLKHLKQLKYLNLFGTLVDEPLLPNWICKNLSTSIEDLQLELTSFPRSIDKFKELTSLVLFGSDDLEIPESICSLSSLQKLDLYPEGNPISLPDFCSNLTALRDLSIKADMEGISPLQHLTGLTNLQFRNHNTEEIIVYPDFLWNLTFLKELDLDGSNVRSLPDALGNLKNLESLKLTYFENSTQFPVSIGDLSSLTRLDIIYCQLTELPEAIGNLTALKHIEFQGCHKLRTLPDSFGCLNSLKILQVGGNNFSRLPHSIGNLQSLERLVMEYCRKLTHLPACIGNLYGLKELLIKECTNLQYIPNSFANLVLNRPFEECSLQRVEFSGCKELLLSRKTWRAVEILEQHGVWKEKV